MSRKSHVGHDTYSVKGRQGPSSSIRIPVVHCSLLLVQSVSGHLHSFQDKPVKRGPPLQLEGISQCCLSSTGSKAVTNPHLYRNPEERSATTLDTLHCTKNKNQKWKYFFSSSWMIQITWEGGRESQWNLPAATTSPVIFIPLFGLPGSLPMKAVPNPKISWL